MDLHEQYVHATDDTIVERSIQSSQASKLIERATCNWCDMVVVQVPACQVCKYHTDNMTLKGGIQLSQASESIKYATCNRCDHAVREVPAQQKQ